MKSKFSKSEEAAYVRLFGNVTLGNLRSMLALVPEGTPAVVRLEADDVQGFIKQLDHLERTVQRIDRAMSRRES